MRISKHTNSIIQKLHEHYGDTLICTLDYTEPWQLLIATILAAQCTDERVNIVTKDLFVKYPGPAAFAGADLKELEKDIHSTGFYHNKARNIIACCRILCDRYEGKVPSTMEELTALPGVGRKTANVIRGNIYGEPSIVVDTHVKRITKRFGLTKETDPEKVEYDLMKKLPKEYWILWNIWLITFGRETCKAQNPQCKDCFMREECREVNKLNIKPS